MTFTEEHGDLFAEEIIQNYALCHCISSDFALGAGCLLYTSDAADER